MNTCKVIAIENQKGGTGKSTTALNLGVGLSQAGKSVLLIDSDPQASLTLSLGVVKPDDLKVNLSTVMMRIINDHPFDDDYGLISCEEGVDLMPSSIELSGIETQMMSVMSREFVLKTYPARISEMSFFGNTAAPDTGDNTVVLTVAAVTALLGAAYVTKKKLFN